MTRQVGFEDRPHGCRMWRWVLLGALACTLVGPIEARAAYADDEPPTTQPAKEEPAAEEDESADADEGQDEPAESEKPKGGRPKARPPVKPGPKAGGQPLPELPEDPEAAKQILLERGKKLREQEKARQAERERQKPKPRKFPPRPRPNDPTRRPKPSTQPAVGPADEAPPEADEPSALNADRPTEAKPAEEDDSEMDPLAEAKLLEELANLPAEERTYQFAFEDIEYAELLDAFSRMSGLAIIGEPPSGRVTFKTTEVMDFHTALNRIKLLLFKHRENFWMQQGDGVLEVFRMTEAFRGYLEPEDIYPSVAAFQAAGREETDLVLLMYAPERGSTEDLMPIRDFLPDYVRMAPSSEGSNVLNVFALVKDVNKFLELVRLFQAVEADPTVIKKIPVQHITATEALNALSELMDLTGGAATRPRRGGKAPTVPVAGTDIKVMPDDAQGVLVVRALPGDIEEIERLLPYVDVALDIDFNPVVIPLQHVTTDDIIGDLRLLLGAAQSGAAAAPEPSRPKGKSRRRTATAGAVSVDDVTVVPEPRNNRLIVLGTDEAVARVRSIVDLLDVESERDHPTIVSIEHADVTELATRVINLVQQIHPSEGKEKPFTATPDPAANTLILVGEKPAIQLAQDLIAQWDTQEEQPQLHKYVLENAKPSEVVNMLARIEGEKVSAVPTPTPRKGKRPKRAPRSRARTAGLSGAGKFIADDAKGLLYVLCTDVEWEDEYLPRIQELDEDARVEFNTHIVEVEHSEPQVVINLLTEALGGDAQDLPTMVAVPDGVMIVNAAPAEIERIESLVPTVDVDEEASKNISRRIFDLQHADPTQVRDVVLQMLTGQRSRVTTAKPRGKRRTPSRTVAPTGEDIKMVPLGERSLMVSAPAEEMEEIAELIAQVDVPGGEPEIREYPFPRGVNVQDVATTLTRLLGGPTRRAPKGGKTAGATSVGDVTVVAQPAANKILVSAPVTEFERVEQIISLIGADSDRVELVYEFIDLESDNAAALVGMIEPLLNAKMSQLIEEGALPAPAVQPRGKGRAPQPSWINLQADPQGDRIIISAPPVIVAEAKALIAELDRPSEDGERVIRTVMLEKTDPEEMTRTIQSMLTGQRQPTRTRQAPRKGGKRPAAAPAVARATGELDVTVTPAPGGSAIVLMGPAKDIEVVEGWIMQLEEGAEGSGKIVKIYELPDADIETVANTLMAVVDSGAATKMPSKPKKVTDDSDWGLEWDTTVTRQGKDLYISGDSYKGTLLIAATPTKMREVDELIEKFISDEKIGETVKGPDPMPYTTYDLQNVDAFDAVYTLEQIIDAVWTHEQKPSVDYIPFTNILVIKGNPDHFKEVEDLVVKYVDQGTGKRGDDRALVSVFGTNMTAGQAALLLKARLESSGIDVDVQQLEPEEAKPTIERINPCLIPSWVFGGAALTLVGQTVENGPSVEHRPAEADAERQAIAAMLREALDEATVRIHFDDETGVIHLQGATTTVVLVGPVKDMEVVEGWITQLEEEAEGSGKIVKVYELPDADIETMADMLTAIVESGAAQRGLKRLTDRDDWGSDWDTTVTRQGQDVQSSAGGFKGIMLVAATPTKMREVNELVQEFLSGDEKVDVKGPGDSIPYKTYELQNVDAVDAVDILEQIIDAVWTHDQKPSIDYIPFTRILVIKGDPDHFDEVEDLIIKYIDKKPGERGPAWVPVPDFGIPAGEMALLLKARLESAGIDVDVQQLEPEEAKPTIERINPCLVPGWVFGGAALSAAGPAVADDPPAEADAEQQAIEALLQDVLDEPLEVNEPESDATLRIRFDDKTGVIYLEGATTAIQDAQDLIKSAKEEAKDLPAPPDIRIYRLKHVDPTKAADILETMFNDRQLRAQQQQLLRMQQQQARARQRQQQQQQGKQRGEQGQQQGRQQQQQTPQVQMPQLTVRVYPNSRERTIIIRAATELYPSIEDLLGTVDKEPTAPLDYKIFELKNTVAEEVEEQLKEMFGLNRRTTRTAGRRTGQSRQASPAGDQGIVMELPTGGTMTASAAEITITSNPSTNTIMAMAPDEAMEAIDRFIQDLESLSKPQFATQTYDLEHADATEVVPQLEELLQTDSKGRGRGGKSEGFDPTAINSPKLLADPRTNSIIVRAMEQDLPKIEELIRQLDVEAPGELVQQYVVTGDADQIARTLQQLYGKGGGGRKNQPGARSVTIVGDATAGVVFVSAPPKLQEEIATRIEMIEEQTVQQFEPRFIKLGVAKPSQVARVIEEALDSGGRNKKSRFQIVGDDTSKQLIVRAPAELVPQIESLVENLDAEPDELVDIRIYPLEHAQATDVLRGLNDLVRQMIRQLQGKTGIDVDMFSATADERSNSLVVMGGPMTFMMVEKVLKDLDQPPRDPTQVVTMMFQLVNSSAADLARNINNIYGRRREKGVDPPQAEANNSSNVVIVRGTKAQVEEIQRDVIEPAEQMAVTTTDELKDARIPLVFAKADEVAQLLTQRFNDKFNAIRRAGLKNIKPAELTVSIVADVNSNALLVTASDSNLEYINQILPEIDREDVGTKSARNSAIYTLEYADPNGVANVINNTFRKGGRVALKDQVQAVVEYATQQVVVTASTENQDRIRELITELDVDRGVGKVQQVYKLKEARASDVANILNQTLSRSRSRTRSGQLAVTVVANDPLNSLVISGTQKDYESILPLLEELDRKPEEMTGLKPVVYTLKYADPGSTIGTIHNAFPRMPGQKPQDNVRAAYAWGTSALVVSASPENQEKVKALLDEIDLESTAQRTLHILDLKDANADELAQRLNQVFSRTRRRARDETPMQILSEPKTNKLLVYANEQEFEDVKAKVALLDVPPSAEKERSILVYPIRYADPNGVVNAINTAFRTRGRVSPADEVSASVEWATQSVIVAASPTNHDKVRDLIENIDQESTMATDLHIVKMEHASVYDVADRLNEIFRSRRTTRRGERPATFSADPRTNSLLVYANGKEFEEVRTLVAELDVPALLETERVSLTYPIRYADPNGIVNVINQTYRSRRMRPEDEVTAVVEWGTQSVIVTASTRYHEKVKTLIEGVDVESTLSRQLNIIKLEHADAESVSRTLQQILRSSRRGTRRGEQPVSVTPDQGTNSLLVYASAKELEELSPLLESLDVEPEFERDRTIKSFKLTYAEASGVKQMIDDTFRARRGRSTNPRDMVTCMSEWGSNSLVVSASPRNMEQVEQLIAEVDQKGAGQRQVHVVTIKHADPASVNQSLQEIFVRGARTRRGETISVSNPRGSDTLLIKANEMEIEEIRQVIADLDKSEADLVGQVEVLTLQNIDATEAESVLQEYLRKPGGRGGRGGAELVGDIRITALPATNSLVVSGDEEEIQRVAEIIAKVDVEPEDDQTAPKVIQLEHAVASDIEPSLSELFGQQSGRRGGRGRGASTGMIPTTIVADDATNSLIVRASAVDFRRIQELVAELDSEEAAGNAPQIIPLEYAQASEVQPKLTDLFAEQRGGRSRRGGSTSPPPVIVADDGSNSLIVRATAADFRQIETLVTQIDTEDAGAGTDLKILTLKPGVNATELADMIDDILDEQERSGGRGRRGRSGGTQPQRVLVRADTRTNSLILSGPSSKFAEIESFIRELEDRGPAGGTVSTIIRLENQDPEEIQRLIEQVVEESKSGSSGSRRGSSGRRRRR